MIFKIILIVALIRLLVVTDKPFLCSGIYTTVVFFFSLWSQAPFLSKLIVVAIIMATSSLYFWLLSYFKDNIILFWIISVVGLSIGLI